MTSSEAFEQDGPWIRSSTGFAVRALGRAGMEYVRGSDTMTLDTESLTTNGFVLWPASIPEDRREQIVSDVTRAWQWAGFGVETIGP